MYNIAAIVQIGPCWETPDLVITYCGTKQASGNKQHMLGFIFVVFPVISHFAYFQFTEKFMLYSAW